MFVSERVACLVPVAASGILRFAGAALRDPFGRKCRIASDVAQAFLHGAFELVTDAPDAVRIYADQLILTGGILCLAACPLGGAIGGELRIANDFAQAFLQSAFKLVADTFDLILVHDNVLSPVYRNRLSTSPRNAAMSSRIRRAAVSKAVAGKPRWFVGRVRRELSDALR